MYTRGLGDVLSMVMMLYWVFWSRSFIPNHVMYLCDYVMRCDQSFDIIFQLLVEELKWMLWFSWCNLWDLIYCPLLLSSRLYRTDVNLVILCDKLMISDLLCFPIASTRWMCSLWLDDIFCYEHRVGYLYVVWEVACNGCRGPKVITKITYCKLC